MVVKRDTSGFRDWLIQRISAVVIAAYAIWLAVFCVIHRQSPVLPYQVWHDLVSLFWFKLSTFVVLLLIVWHAWIGLWTVATDYLHAKCVQKTVLLLVAALLLSYMAWGSAVIWG